MPILGLALIVSLISGVCAHQLARRKRRSTAFWTSLTVIFVLPLIILILLPEKGLSAIGIDDADAH